MYFERITIFAPQEKNKAMANQIKGKISQIIGWIIDVLFQSRNYQKIYDVS